jgi:hypothetical protein
MSGYIGSKASVTLVDGYNRTEADAEFVQDPNGAITVSGSNVGIGTSSPSANLDVASSNATIHLTDTDDTTYAEIRNNGGTLTIASDQGDAATNSSINFKVDASEAMRIDGSGNLLVGTTSITAPIVNNAGAGITLRGSNGQIYAGGADTQPLTLNRETSDGDIVQFRKDGSTVGGISVTGSATAYNTSSDYRLKENITPVQGASDIVKAMKPCTYTFKSDGSWHDGFLAHELQELHPRAVIGSKDAMQDEEYEVTPAVYEDIIIPAVEAVAEVPAVYDAEGVLVSEMVPAVEAEAERTEQQLVSEAVMGTRSVPDYQGVDYSKLTPILTAALQEALNKIDALEAQNATFEARLVALEAV